VTVRWPRFTPFLEDGEDRRTAPVQPGRWLRSIARTWRDGTLALLFPGACLVCEVLTTAGPFCEACRAELLEASGSACPRCARKVGPSALLEGGCSACRGRPLGFDQALALGPYQGPIRDACLKLKHAHHAWLAPWLADLIAEAHSGRLAGRTEALLVPIPLHWRRGWSRGYNQAGALASGLARRLRIPVVEALRRTAPTPPLARLSRHERQAVLRHAFRVRDAAAIRGREVLLVDDILTTGSTCGEAARTLKRAGAGPVTAIVVARTEG
jgi:ComF family protein